MLTTFTVIFQHVGFEHIHCTYVTAAHGDISQKKNIPAHPKYFYNFHIIKEHFKCVKHYANRSKQTSWKFMRFNISLAAWWVSKVHLHNKLGSWQYSLHPKATTEFLKLSILWLTWTTRGPLFFLNLSYSLREFECGTYFHSLTAWGPAGSLE